MAQLNPFIYDRPVSAEELIDRDKESTNLVDHAAGGHNALLAAPRRYGKTTLLQRVCRDAEKVGMHAVYVDFDGVLSLADLETRIAEAYDSSLRGPAGRLWQAIKPKPLSAGYADGQLSGRVSVRFGSGPEGSEFLKLLDLPSRIYEKTAMRCLVVFDEFQVVLAAADNADGIIRSRIQHQAQAASYIFAGSAPGLLGQLFSDQARPLFGQARRFELTPLRDEDLADYIGERFDRTRRDHGEVLGALLGLARGHPQRAMMLSHHLWSVTPEGRTADWETWNLALDAVFGELQEAFRAAWDSLSETDGPVLAAVAQGHSPLSKSTLETYGISKSGAVAGRERLIEKGHLKRIGEDRLVLVDPLFEDWIRAGRRRPAYTYASTTGTATYTVAEGSPPQTRVASKKPRAKRSKS